MIPTPTPSPRRLRILLDPQPTTQIVLPAEGFAKKGPPDNPLGHRHVDLTRRCAAGCDYCSTNTGTSTRIQKSRLKGLARAQFADVPEGFDPTRDPDTTIVWDPEEVWRRLVAQMEGRSSSWGAGETWVISMLTDAFIGRPLTSGLTERVVCHLLRHTKARLRILTKSEVVARPPWIDLFATYADRVVVGLSTGSYDDAWAARAERRTSPPTRRLRALETLRREGIPVFGMACPLFPHTLDGDHLDRLLDAIDPARVEQLYWEGFNDRQLGRALGRTYPEASPWRTWFEKVFGPGGDRVLWSQYITELYTRIRARAARDGWLDKMVFLLYEDELRHDDAKRFPDLRGVYLQSATDEVGVTKHSGLRTMHARLVLAEELRRFPSKRAAWRWAHKVASAPTFDALGFEARERLKTLGELAGGWFGEPATLPTPDATRRGVPDHGVGDFLPEIPLRWRAAA